MPTTAAPEKTPGDESTTPSATGIERLQGARVASEIQFLIARARGRGNAHANLLLAELDLKVRHFAVLSLVCTEEQPTQRELGEFLDLDPSQIVALVDTLEARGALRRETDPRDRRSKIVVPTESGHDLHEQAAALTRESEETVLQTLSPRERRQLRALLQKVAF